MGGLLQESRASGGRVSLLRVGLRHTLATTRCCAALRQQSGEGARLKQISELICMPGTPTGAGDGALV